MLALGMLRSNVNISWFNYREPKEEIEVAEPLEIEADVDGDLDCHKTTNY